MIKNYWGVYLSKHLEGASAKGVPTHPGFFKYRKLYTAHTTTEVASQIIEAGGTPVEIEIAKARHPILDKVSREFKEEFLAAIIYNLEGGLSAGKAFLAVADSEYGEVRTKLELGVRIIQRGGSFSDAMRAIGFFDLATLAILDAGERTGTMRAAVTAAIEHYAGWAKGIKALSFAAGMLLIDFIGAISSVAGNKWGFIPMMEKNGIETDDPLKKLEFSHRLLITSTLNDILFYPACLLGVAVVVGIIFYIADDPAPRKWIESKVSRITYLGDALRHNALASSTKVLSALLAGGVPLLPAIEIAKRGTRNVEINTYWNAVSDALEKGEPVARAIQSGMLDSTESIALAAHSNSQQLSHIVSRIADRRQEKGRLAMKQFLWLSGGISVIYNIASICIGGYVWILQNSSISG